MPKTETVFEQWRQDLELRPDFWGMRVFRPVGGFVWRNLAAREYYAKRGFFAAERLSWVGVKKYLTAAELAALQLIYAATFASKYPVQHTLTAQAAGHAPCTTRTHFLAVQGNVDNGIIITHLQPFPEVVDGLSMFPTFDAPQQATGS